MHWEVIMARLTVWLIFKSIIRQTRVKSEHHKPRIWILLSMLMTLSCRETPIFSSISKINRYKWKWNIVLRIWTFVSLISSAIKSFRFRNSNKLIRNMTSSSLPNSGICKAFQFKICKTLKQSNVFSSNNVFRAKTSNTARTNAAFLSSVHTVPSWDSFT